MICQKVPSNRKTHTSHASVFGIVLNTESSLFMGNLTFFIKNGERSL